MYELNNNIHIHQKKKKMNKKALMKCFAYFYGFQKTVVLFNCADVLPAYKSTSIYF